MEYFSAHFLSCKRYVLLGDPFGILLYSSGHPNDESTAELLMLLPRAVVPLLHALPLHSMQTCCLTNFILSPGLPPCVWSLACVCPRSHSLRGSHARQKPNTRERLPLNHFRQWRTIRSKRFWSLPSLIRFQKVSSTRMVRLSFRASMLTNQLVRMLH